MDLPENRSNGVVAQQELSGARGAVAVFCGSQSGVLPEFEIDARSVGQLLAENHLELIYGGGNTGLMGAVATGCLESGGSVTGVIPRILVTRECAHQGLTQIHVVENMHIRKQMMYQLSDAFIILPGGNGTLDELFESITWNTLDIHRKKIMLLNTAHYYDALLEHFERMKAAGFLYNTAPFTVCQSPEELIPLLTIN